MESIDGSIKKPWSELFKLFVLLLLCSLIVSFGVIVIGALLGLDINEIGSVQIDNDARRTYFSYLVMASGSIGTFLLPAYFFQRRSPHLSIFPKANRKDWWIYVIPVIFLLVLAPLINLVGEWNMNMKFSEAFSGVERWMREQEDSMAQLMAQTVMTDKWDRLLLNVIVIGILPAICEEFFFRGALQHIFNRICKNEHLAIWTVAIIFSAIHFQFYGFFPRLILGVIFGYAVVWTGNIWSSVLAHFVNNTSVVLIAFIYANEGKSYDALMELDTYPIITYLGSLVFSAIIGIAFYRYIKKEAIWKKAG